MRTCNRAYSGKGLACNMAVADKAGDRPRAEPESRHDGLAAEASFRFRSYSPLKDYSGKFPESRRVLTRAFHRRQHSRRVAAP